MDVLPNFERLFNKYGNVIKGWLGPFFFVATREPEIIIEVLANKNLIDKPFFYNFTFPHIDPSTIFVANGHLWTKKRKMITPAFHLNMLTGYLSVFNSKSRSFIENLGKEVGKPGFDISKYNNVCSLEIALETFLGVDAALTEKQSGEVVEAVHAFEHALIYRVTKPWLYPNTMYFLSPVGKKVEQHVRELRTLIDEILVNSKNKGLKKAKNSLETKIQDMQDPNVITFLDILLREKDKGNISTKEVLDDLITIITAGFSTTAFALGFAVNCLMKNQDVQEKVFGELDAIFCGSDRDVTTSDLQKMNYLESVIKESLRFYSTVPLIAREMKEDVTLKSGYTLPKGTIVSLCFYHAHRRPDIFPDPDHFIPERFSKDNSVRGSFNNFFPFSEGARICIGKKYAMIEMKVILTLMLRKYKILPPTDGRPDVKPCFNMLLHSTTGFHVRIEER